MLSNIGYMDAASMKWRIPLSAFVAPDGSAAYWNLTHTFTTTITAQDSGRAPASARVVVRPQEKRADHVLPSAKVFR
jgi:hypothetical protein